MSQRTIIVKDLKVITSGTSDKTGNEWTLYEVSATTEDGTNINESLKTFGEIPMDVPVQVELEQNEYKGNTEYMVRYDSKTGTGGVGLGRKVQDLTYRLDQLEAKVASMTGGAAPASPPAPADDDIPF